MRAVRESVLVADVSWRLGRINEPTGGGRLELGDGAIMHGLSMRKLPTVEEFQQFTFGELRPFLGEARRGR
ncbi:MAG: hypothetical protein H0W15_11220 [Gemmatimonadales bacterium]|jgi:hypothetical protein|nr:hypothetical protein [Gemmatimonadales bacterium]